MEHLLSSFLLKNKYCPLPTVGSLSIQHEEAIASITEKLIMAPKPVIIFAEKEMDAAPLLDFIAAWYHHSVAAASSALSDYCSRLQQIQPYEKIDFGNLGYFSKDEFGQVQFSHAAALQHYLSPVAANRVIHPDASHQMLVGDRATNTVYMQEMLAAEESKKWPKWAWAALVLAVLAAAVIIVSLLNKSSGSQVGVDAKEAPATYKTSSN